MLDWVLVGGGHAHVQVVRRFMMRPVSGVRLTLVLDRAEAVYSGMVPGLVAGDYAAHELEIDCWPLARRADARVVLAPAIRVDPTARKVELEGRPPVAYDLASLDVGSSVRGLDLPGVRDHALATRPIRQFIDRLEARLRAAEGEAGSEPLRVAVVGGGAAGVELAFTLEARLRTAGRAAELTVVAEDDRPLPGVARRVAERALRELARRRIAWRGGARVEAVLKDAVVVDGERVPCHLAVWATGAAPQPLGAASALPLDPRGFVRVRDTLQVVGHDDLFAVGDCAALEAHPWVPRAGVYAVRQGPVLDANLRARTAGGALRPYRPQRDFLALLNLGDRHALGSKWGRTASGRAVWRLKDAIDRRFMRRFQVLDADARPAPDFPAPDAMGDESMACGGCAAKLEAPRLDAALARLAPAPADPSVLLGLAQPDDAAAWRQGDATLVATLDAFRAFTDDPWLVGRVAAVNAVSDVYAVGARPGHALALVSIPEAEGARAEELLYQVLAGVRAALDPLGVALVGGHTTRGAELQVGLSVTGMLEPGDAAWALAGLAPGDALVLTKPLGTGVLLAADMQGRLPGCWVEPLHASLVRPNAEAARVARRLGVRAATDVSGFGLARHALEMARASDVRVRLHAAALPALPGAENLLAQGLRSSFHEQNRLGPSELEAPDGPPSELGFDPQTSGGLLLAIPEERATELVEALREAGDPASRVGHVSPATGPGPRLAVVAD